MVLDYKLCPRRLAGPTDGEGNRISGFLISKATGTSQDVIFTNEPCVLYPELSILSGQSFGSIVLAAGDQGCHKRLLPPETEFLFLQTDGAGAFKLGSLPNLPIPDPLAVTNFTATNASITNLTATAITSPLMAGTILKTIGLNASNQFVTGTLTGQSKAVFYESGTSVSAGTPNAGLNLNDLCIIGNELYDPDNISQVNNQNTIRINETGSYEIEWQGLFGLTGTTQSPAVYLRVNGTVVNQGGRAMHTGGVVVSPFHWSHVQDLTNGDLITLQVGGTSATNVNLTDVRLILSKFK